LFAVSIVDVASVLVDAGVLNTVTLSSSRALAPD
jgi:hypothetical protein